MANTLIKIKFCLERGILPKDTDVRTICEKIAVQFACLSSYAKVNKRNLRIHVHSVDNEISVPVESMALVWLDRLRDVIDENERVIIESFSKTAVYIITDDIELYVAEECHPCQRCRRMFYSAVNSRRCEASHVSRKNLAARSLLPLEKLKEFWDLMPNAKRLYIMARIADSIQGATMDGKMFSRYGVNADDLFEEFDNYLENTTAYKILDDIDDVLHVHWETEQPTIIASIFIRVLATAYSVSVSNALLRDLDTPCADILLKPPTVSLKMKQAAVNAAMKSFFERI